MEKDKNDIEIKVRSSQACIREGYQLYSANFRKIFRATWWLAVGFAILQAIASALPVLLSPTLLLPATALGVVAGVLWLYAANWRIKKRLIIKPLRPLVLSSWFRHGGKVLLVSIVCITIVALLTLLTSLPTVILMAANWQSQIGVLNGDPSGMPSQIRWLSLGVFAIAGFIQAYVWLTVIMPFYLMKGSMGEQDKEKAEFNKKTI